MLVGIARMVKGVVALRLARGANVLGVGELTQRRLRLIAAGHGVVLHRPVADAAVNEEAIAVDKLMSFGAMTEGIEETFLAHDAFDKVVIRVTGLHAVFASLVLGSAALLVVLIQAMRLEHRLGDLWNGQRLEDSPIGTELQARQAWLDDRRIPRAAKAGFALDE